MISLRSANDRGQVKTDWLDGRHTFSFGHYYDPAHMGFGPLRVINEDIIAPGGGFPTHAHANMEILTVILEGALQHRDSLGTGSVIRPGEVQRMSAGSGIQHSEFNATNTDPVHLLQIWIQPDRLNIPPSYEQKTFSEEIRRNRLCLIAAPDGRDGALTLQQNARVYSATISANECIEYSLEPHRQVWMQIARGTVEINGQLASAGDGVAVTDEASVKITATSPAEILLFDLP